MKIYTTAGPLAFSTFTFPDGQPHFKLESYDIDFRSVTIEAKIASPADLLTILLANDVLRNHGYETVNLDIRYLMGARMDRAIDTLQPYTLQTVSRLVNGAGFSRVRMLDVHSDVATRLIRNSENVLPVRVVDSVMSVAFWGHSTTIVTPDKGAVDRVNKIVSSIWCGGSRVTCEKKRDMATGKLSGFTVLDKSSVLDNCLIIDDICDGGGTFVGLASELRAAGAKKVSLYVTHGIFSKGPDALLGGIDRIYTTDSYCDGNFGYVPVIPTTVIPVSMKDIP